MIDSAEALRMGIVQKVVDANELMNEAMQIAKKITHHGPNAIKTIKKVVRTGYNKEINEAFNIERTEFSNLFESDGPEGMKAFIEKRKPNWK